MTAVPKYILKAPVSDHAKLVRFVEECLKQGVSLLAVYGPDCEILEQVIDEIIVADRRGEESVLCTSSHPGATLQEVTAFAQTWDAEEKGEVIQVAF